MKAFLYPNANTNRKRPDQSHRSLYISLSQMNVAPRTAMIAAATRRHEQSASPIASQSGACASTMRSTLS